MPPPADTVDVAAPGAVIVNVFVVTVTISYPALRFRFSAVNGFKRPEPTAAAPLNTTKSPANAP